MRILAAALVWFALALSSAAQQVSPDVLIVDSERLFTETLYGRRIKAELDQQIIAVQAENERIAETLREEERSLTLRRPEMTPEAFRAEADAFDTKVQEVRSARDAKTVEFQAMQIDARARFEERVQSVVADVMIERGSAVVLEQRHVVLSVRSANITDDVIVRIDAQLGDGSR